MLRSIGLGFLVISFVFIPQIAVGQQFVPDKEEVVKARVLEVLSDENKIVPGTAVETVYQNLRVIVLEGSKEGGELVVENDYLGLSVGDKFYLMIRTDGIDGNEYYSVVEPYRIPALIVLFALFILATVIFGGWQGVRGLIALALSFFFIIYMLFPGILAGYSPVLVSIAVSSVIIVLGSYITHGFNRTTSAAVVGMIITIILTGILAALSIYFGKLSGFESDEAVYLNVNTGGTLDIAGVLLGGFLIGLLGVLYDVSIGQAVSVDELRSAAPAADRRHVYSRALRIGREHTGALVNTLAIAYVGASLPLLLLFTHSASGSLEMILNRELFATEVVRTLVGSIGLVMAVPITTLIAAWTLVGRNLPPTHHTHTHKH